MKYLIAISLLISHTAAAQLSGRYVTNEELMIGGQDEIMLNSNGTGTYMPGSCLGPVVSEAHWRGCSAGHPCLLTHPVCDRYSEY